MKSQSRFVAVIGLLAMLPSAPAAQAAPGPFTITQVIDYPFESELTASEKAPAVAWIRNLRGVRNLWIAQGPNFKPNQLTHYDADDGQELTQPTFSPDGSHLVYVRGGDHDANWPAAGNLPPDPNSSASPPEVAIYSASLSGAPPVRVAEGDGPALSARGQLVYVKDGQVWTASLDGTSKPERLFFDRGHDGELSWSPDGAALAFVSRRGDHAFIGIYHGKTAPITWLAPSTDLDSSPRWSPDSTRVAFVRNLGDGGPPEPWLRDIPHPWSIWTANAGTGQGEKVWASPDTPEGSFPEVAGGANLFWAAADHLVFLAELDGWEHLYSLPAGGGVPTLLTPGPYMVEDVCLTPGRDSLVFSANYGTLAGDDERRHLFRVSILHGPPTTVTEGPSIEWRPVLAGTSLFFIQATVRQPPNVERASLDGTNLSKMDDGGTPDDFPAAQFVDPKPVTFKSGDGQLVHGQLFQSPTSSRSSAGVIFVHGGPPRQMMLGWHYMGYYSNAYAMNQYLAAHGFTVLSVNYRLGIGYGRAFQHPEKAGPEGASEYQDVLAGARFLQSTPGVDPTRIGIWGGSYGGYLTGLALARDSETFKAGVDLHGVHDWSREIGREAPLPFQRYEQGDREEGMAVAFKSSPDADLATWRSPVLLIQGDDDRNVDFGQTVDLARRLESGGVRFEELVLPDEIHGFLRYESWLKADSATAGFLMRELKAGEN